jgi:putative nucleotide binding protein
VKPNVTLSTREKVYIGKDAKDKIDHIRNRLAYDELTLVAKSELATVIEELVRGQEDRFVSFFNNASAVTPRMHALELIPGIGKKYMWGILDQREKQKFKSYEDLQKRTGIPDPAKLLVRRILDELEKEEKYRLFTRP